VIDSNRLKRNRQAKETRQAMGLLKRCLALNPRHQEALHLFYRLQEQGQEQEQESGASSYPVAKDQVTPPSASYWLRSNRIHRERWNETARN